MIKKVILIGNLGRDPEVRSTPSGQPVASFTLATSRRWRDKSGQKQEQTGGPQIGCWGRQGGDAVPPDRVLGPPGGGRRAVPAEGQADLRRGPAPDPVLGRPPDRREALPD